MNLIITSEHRVGSRWLHYMIADLLGMDKSPEMDVKKVGETSEIRKRFKQNKVVKFHHATQSDILEVLEPWDYFIIGVVRNPMDRLVSLTFHNRYHHKKEHFKQHEFATDKEAVKYTVMDDPWAKQWNENQFKLMLPGYSTRNTVMDKIPYIWTTYEWMHQQTHAEVESVVDWLGVEGITEKFLHAVVSRNSFETKARRKKGDEVRSDLWRRKGVLGDWRNWFDDEMIEATKGMQEKYQQIVASEVQNGNS